MWKTGVPVFPPKKWLVTGRASDHGNKMQIRSYLLRQPLIGKKAEKKQHYYKINKIVE